MIRPPPNLSKALPLLLVAAVVALWVRSYRVMDVVECTPLTLRFDVRSHRGWLVWSNEPRLRGEGDAWDATYARLLARSRQVYEA